MTDREVRVLACMARGLTLNEAGRALYLATGTVARHLAAARAALGAKSTAQAVALAVAAGLVVVDLQDTRG